MADKALDSSGEEEPTISEDLVVTKYKMAGDMANRKYRKYGSFFEQEKKLFRSLNMTSSFYAHLSIHAV